MNDNPEESSNMPPELLAENRDALGDFFGQAGGGDGADSPTGSDRMPNDEMSSMGGMCGDDMGGCGCSSDDSRPRFEVTDEKPGTESEDSEVTRDQALGPAPSVREERPDTEALTNVADQIVSRRSFLGVITKILAVLGVLGTAGPLSAGKTYAQMDPGDIDEDAAKNAGYSVEVREDGTRWVTVRNDAGNIIYQYDVREGPEDRRWVMVIDLAKCDGCEQCLDACQKMHHIPSEREWIKVHKKKDSEKGHPYWFPQPCFHCDNPPCTKGCPVNATWKRQDGVVLIDNQRCIGCRQCMAQCPYNARHFNWDAPEESPDVTYSPERGMPRQKGTTEKCDFCVHRSIQGELPACAEACTMDAIYYGDEYEDAVTNHSGETVRLSKLLEERAGYRYKEYLGTKPSVYYLPPKDREYAAPDEGDIHERYKH